MDKQENFTVTAAEARGRRLGRHQLVLELYDWGERTGWAFKGTTLRVLFDKMLKEVEDGDS